MKWIKYLYLFLFIYIIAAIIFWGSALNSLNNQLYEADIKLLATQKEQLTNENYKKLEQQLLEKQQTRTRQYMGEGAVFLLVILVGAAVVYSSIKRVNRLSKLQNNFMLSVTHELKSPIAGVKLNLQTLLRKNIPENKKEVLILRAINESNRLNELCNNLLLASQMEGNKLQLNMESFSISELCLQVIEEMESRSPHELIADVKENCTISGDAVLIKIAINNLVENAIKYSPANGAITLSLKELDQQVSIAVKDQGVGVPDNEKLKIYNKFYRVGEENSRKTKGTGLGLYLTSEIAKLHKAHLVVSDNTPQGTIFELSFDTDTI